MAFTDLKAHAEYSKNWNYIRNDSVPKLFLGLQNHVDFSNQFRYVHSNTVKQTLSNFRGHGDFSRKLSSTNKNRTDEIRDLVGEWVKRFDSLGTIDANGISGTLNTLSKLDIFDGKWSTDDRENFKKLIFHLAKKGDEFLDPKNRAIIRFGSWQVANSLNALSKWNLRSNVSGDRQVDIIKSFINKLMHRGIYLLDAINKKNDKFTDQVIANCLNALSKLNIGDFEGAREFTIRLLKEGNSSITGFNSLAILLAV
ncbi:hypothetical protein U1Q18_052053 [Sarracenia purpurea var. burkii]